ncbi:MAG: hypothetical protein HUJ26_13205 [Planctomycetaceae bacterium]|nr:hypothetical protein [Planctomycetaceae bacterium]
MIDLGVVISEFGTTQLKYRSLAIWFIDFSALIFVLGAWQTKDQAQKSKNEFPNTCGKHIPSVGESKVAKTIGFRSKMRTFEVDQPKMR